MIAVQTGDLNSYPRNHATAGHSGAYNSSDVGEEAGTSQQPAGNQETVSSRFCERGEPVSKIRWKAIEKKEIPDTDMGLYSQTPHILIILIHTHAYPATYTRMHTCIQI